MSYTLNYTGSEIDDILDRAAPGGALDTAIAAKQDALTFDAVPTQGSTNPAESGGIYDAIQAGGAAALAAFATDSVSGDVVSFPDGASNIPVKSFTGSIVPVQNLNGYDNPWPAGGGANKWDEQWEVGGISQETGQNSSASNTIRAKNICACSPSTTYYLGTYVAAIYWYGTGDAYISFDYNNASGNVRTSPSTATGFRLLMKSGYGTTYNHDIAVNYPSTVTTYSPYSNICPISGWSGANITRAGANLYDDSTASVGSYINASGVVGTSSGNVFSLSDYIRIGGDKVTITNPGGWGSNPAVCFFDEDKNYVGGTHPTTNPVTLTIPSGAAYLRTSLSTQTRASTHV